MSIPARWRLLVLGSVPFITSGIVISYQHRFYRLCCILHVLFLSSALHWTIYKHGSLSHILDMACAITTMYHITYIDSKRFTPLYQTRWNRTVRIGIISYLVQWLFFLSVKRMPPYVYPISVLCHIFFLHMAPMVVCCQAMCSSPHERLL